MWSQSCNQVISCVVCYCCVYIIVHILCVVMRYLGFSIWFSLCCSKYAPKCGTCGEAIAASDVSCACEVMGQLCMLCHCMNWSSDRLYKTSILYWILTSIPCWILTSILYWVCMHLAEQYNVLCGYIRTLHYCNGRHALYTVLLCVQPCTLSPSNFP